MRSSILVFILFGALAVLFTLPILISASNLGIQDWDHHLAFLELARKSVIEYKQFPLWDSFHCGGMPAFGNPQSGIISVTFLFVLLFGTLLGVKISIAVHFFIALSGSFLLAKYFKFSDLAALTSSIIFAFSGVGASALSTGMLPFLYFSYLPFIGLYLRKVVDEPKNSTKFTFISAFFLALTYYGGYQISAVTIPVIFIYLITHAVFKKNIYPIKIGAIFLTIFFILISPKLFLNVKLTNTYPRYTQDQSGYNPRSLLYFLLSPKQNIEGSVGIDHSFFNYEIDENSFYIGYLSFVLAILGFFKSGKKYKIFTLILIWILIGTYVPISLYEILGKLPFYDQFRVAQRFRFPLILIIAILAGHGMNWLEKRVRRTALLSFITIFIFTDLFVFSNTNFISKTFIIKNEWLISKTLDFTLHASYPVDYARLPGDSALTKYAHKYLPWGTEYPAIRSGIFQMDCSEQIPLPKIKIVTNPNLVFINSNEASILSFSPNKITIKVQGMGDRVLRVNQNYFAGWIAKNQNGQERKVYEEGDILAINIIDGDAIITLSYNPFRKYE